MDIGSQHQVRLQGHYFLYINRAESAYFGFIFSFGWIVAVVCDSTSRSSSPRAYTISVLLGASEIMRVMG